MAKYNFSFDIGEFVYIRTDMEQIRRQVIGIMVMPNNCIKYQLSIGSGADWCYELEISRDIDMSIRLGIDKKE